MTRIKTVLLLLSAILFIFPTYARSRESGEAISITVAMNAPENHHFQVEIVCSGFNERLLDFILPNWSPGYYRLMDFTSNIKDFRAADGGGKKLGWEKSTINRWRVAADNSRTIKVTYNVNSIRRFVGNSFLDESHGYIVPASVFMHPAGRIYYPLTVKIKPHKDWEKISTGLDPVPGEQNTYSAENFDTLYDSPILIGNQNTFSFKWNNRTYNIAIKDGPYSKQKKLAKNLLRMVQSATNVIGDIPYRHYTFIFMGKGRGGIEHQNSMVAFSRIPPLKDAVKFHRWLSFIAHEFFHLYNIKTIRPLALGPFDYTRENLTSMLWLSEGGTVYYQNIIMNRAGFVSPREVLDIFGKIIQKYESSPGNRKMSVARASYETWTTPFFGSADTISYYDKGAGICLLLDLKIRYESGGSKSLDDVMKKLYTRYHKQLERGFTDKEFWAVCEDLAGCSLSELGEYVNTTREINYGKYLGYAGLKLVITEKKKQQKEYKLVRIPNPGKLESAIFKNWLKDR